MDRRTFVIEAGKAFPIVAGALYLVGCGSNSSTPVSPSAVADVLSTSTVANGHTHTLDIPASDQLHPIDFIYTSSSTLNHTHLVALTASDLSTIAAGGSVTILSATNATTGFHQHNFTFQGKK